MLTLTGLLSKGLEKKPDKTALSFFRAGRKESRLSFADLDLDSNGMAHFLGRAGIYKGDHVALLVDKSLFFVVAYIAIQKIGAVAIPFNPEFKPAELAYLLTDANPKLVLASSRLRDAVDEAGWDGQTVFADTQVPYDPLDLFFGSSKEFDSPALLPQDPALMIYTSGTTGNPKGVMLNQDNLCRNAEAIIDAWQIKAEDCLCHALPLFHIHGLCFALHTCLAAGSRTLLVDRFVPAHVLDLLEKGDKDQPCTLFMGVPTMYHRLMDAAGDGGRLFDHIRLWAVGSAPLLEKDFQRIQQVLGREPVEREGMSETGMNFTNPLNGLKKPGAIGLPLPGLDVRVVDPDTSEDAAPGQIGEFWLKGPAVFSGYFNKPDETGRAFADGWFKTGDLGRVDEDGYYFLTDRLKNIIISGGENISPKEIENVINQLDGVAEVSVLGVPDPQWGEKVVAAVVPLPGAMVCENDVRQACKTRLHDWKCPKQIRFFAGLPKNTMGKVLRERLADEFLSSGGTTDE